jgi:hypothetical protein
MRTDGDIREVIRTVVSSPEFLAADAYGAKVKSPLELVLSMRRALAAPVDTAAEVIDLLLALEQPPMGRESPDGWPETGAGWLNVGAMRTRVDLATRIAQGGVPSIPIERSPIWRALVGRPADTQVQGMIDMLLNGRVSAETRASMSAAAADVGGGDGYTARDRLRELIALALSSPEFQRR